MNRAAEMCGIISNVSLYVQIGSGTGVDKKESGKIFKEIMVKNFPHVVILTGTTIPK